jgi:hypothetical protein
MVELVEKLGFKHVEELILGEGDEREDFVKGVEAVLGSELLI